MVQVDTWRTAYAGIVPQAHLDAMSYERREGHWRDVLSGAADGLAFAHVGVLDGQVVGFVIGGSPDDVTPATARFGAQLQAIYILAAAQGRGLGRLLVRALVADLAAAGLSSMFLWVLADNPACRFYVSLGGRVADRRNVSIGGADLAELAYGWDDLAGIP